MLTIYLFGLGILWVVYGRLLLSPLSKIPGPPLACATRLVLMYYEFTRRRRRWIHQLHVKYGPVVRIAPDEVSFANWDAVKEIYVSDGSGYDKTSFYRLFDNYGHECMFSTLDKTPHGERKKRFSDRYSKSFIMQPEVMDGIRERAEGFVARCTEKAGVAADIYILLHCYAIDCITHHLYDPQGMRSLTEAADLMTVKELLFTDNFRESYFQYYFPDLTRLISRVFSPANRLRLLAARTLNTTRRSDISNHTVLSKFLSSSAQLETKSIASELLDHAIAGIDTAGDGLCFLLHHLSLPASASIQEALRAELTEKEGTPIDELPYLDAVMKEGLRCFSPVPMSLPRRVPKGGRTIAGAYVPEDTIVSCQAYTLHRLNADVFPDPEEFRPERWLKKEYVLERNQLFFAFATGGRGCIGKHLAMLEMKMLLKEVYSTCRTHISPDMTASMEQLDEFITTRPIDQKCLIVFEKVI